MTPEREREVERICQEALACDRAARDAFLTDVCRGDDELRRDVESLLAFEESAAGFLGTPALEVAAEDLATDVSPVATGRSLGPYGILTLLGSGGMGEVYRARDTRLNREVAIKVLPEGFARDPDRLARLEREATLLASVNHPNIAGIHGLEEHQGTRVLVLELVEGRTLADRLERGPIPVEESLQLALQIAEAIEAAHEKGVIHRDLKPANIKVTPDGRIKVLDFGLAKALVPDDTGDPARMPNPTLAGAIMGTPAYMSPEQARGEAPGRQTDIWSFGVVLYELLTGTSLFGRPSTAETLASVLGTPPDCSALPPDTPATARHLIRRCLEKDRKRRWHHMGDVRIEVEEALASLTSLVAPIPANGTPRKRPRWQAGGALALAALAGIAGWWLAHRSTATTPAAVIRLSIPSVEPPFLSPFGSRHLAISADGSRVAYASADRLWIRRMGQTEALPLTSRPRIRSFLPTANGWVLRSKWRHGSVESSCLRRRTGANRHDTGAAWGWHMAGRRHDRVCHQRGALSGVRERRHAASSVET